MHEAQQQAWELTRYRAYQACLAGHTVGQTFGLAVTFLTLTGANAASTTNIRQPAAHGNPAALEPEPGT